MVQTESKGVSVKDVASITASGVSNHSKKALELINKLISIAKGLDKTLSIKSPEKLKSLAIEFLISTENKRDPEIAMELGAKLLNEFEKKDDSALIFSKRALKKQTDYWKKLNAIPRGINREIDETALAVSKVSNPNDASLASNIIRTSLAEGWGSAMIENELSDIIFGMPVVTKKSVGGNDYITGFSENNIPYHLGGKFRASLVPLLDNIVNGRIRGVAAIAGSDSPSSNAGTDSVKLIKELIKNDCLVIQTGKCSIESVKAGLFKPEAKDLAGKGLKEVCKAVGIPPVIDMGLMSDNSRILLACAAIAKEAGLAGIDDLPIAGASFDLVPAEMLSIGWYFVSSGALVVFGAPSTIIESKDVVNLITKDIEGLLGGKWAFEPDPVKAARIMIDHIDKKRSALKLAPMMY